MSIDENGMQQTSIGTIKEHCEFIANTWNKAASNGDLPPTLVELHAHWTGDDVWDYIGTANDLSSVGEAHRDARIYNAKLEGFKLEFTIDFDVEPPRWIETRTRIEG